MIESHFMAIKRGLKTLAEKNDGFAKVGRFAYRLDGRQLFYIDGTGIPRMLTWPIVEENESLQRYLEADLGEYARFSKSEISDEAKDLTDQVVNLQGVFDQLESALRSIKHRLQLSRDRKFTIIRDEQSSADESETDEVEPEEESGE